jgi:hypothetical protein
MLSETDKAWAAGFLEGEGSFGIIWYKSSYLGLRISAEQAEDNIAPLLKLQRLFGGNVNPRSARRARSKGVRARDTYIHSVTGSATIPMLEAIMPYMITTKAKDADILYRAAKARLQFLDGRRTKKGTTEVLRPFRAEMDALRPVFDPAKYDD